MLNLIQLTLVLSRGVCLTGLMFSIVTQSGEECAVHAAVSDGEYLGYGILILFLSLS
jgi:hypothetical protein